MVNAPDTNILTKLHVTRRLLASVLGVAALTASSLVSAGSKEPPIPACRSLTPPEGTVFLADPVWVHAGALPAHCEVQGRTDNRIDFLMRLPFPWSQRFMMAGCGGFCGELLADKSGHSNSINEAVKRGYAAIAHDGGHQARSWETDWADDPKALDLWAHEILPVVVELGETLARAVYGEEPRFKYFSGCSNGGRLGLIAAQRYPDLFDGIAAGASVVDLSGTAGLWGNWLISNAYRQNALPQNAPLLDRRVASLVGKIVAAECDVRDGQADGMISDPASCKVDFESVRCAGNDCLSDEQASALNRLYQGVMNEQGHNVYPGASYGSEYYGDVWLFGTETQPAWGVLASAGYRRLLQRSVGDATGDSALSTEAMQQLIARSHVPAITDANDPNLQAFIDAGGKLLVYHGLADPLILPDPIEDYFDNAAVAVGGKDILDKTARLFMIPGWGHCWEKPAPVADQFDPLEALEPWVEDGQPPETLVIKNAAGERKLEVSKY